MFYDSSICFESIAFVRFTQRAGNALRACVRAVASLSSARDRASRMHTHPHTRCHRCLGAFKCVRVDLFSLCLNLSPADDRLLAFSSLHRMSIGKTSILQSHLMPVCVFIPTSIHFFAHLPRGAEGWVGLCSVTHTPSQQQRRMVGGGNLLILIRIYCCCNSAVDRLRWAH